MRSTFSILFYINRKKLKDNQVPVMGRITINGTQAYFSCKCSINPELWNTHQNCAIGKSPQAQLVNKYLGTYRTLIIQTYQQLLQSSQPITALQIKNQILSTGNDYTTLLKYMKEDINTFTQRVGKDRAVMTLKKMEIVYRHTSNFIKVKYRTNDIFLPDITPNFITSFASWLQTAHSLSQSTIWIYTTYLKKIVTNAHTSGKITTNPFSKFRMGPSVKQRQFLTEEELLHLLTYSLSNPDLQIVRDIYLFSCLTGISYIDIANLKHENIHTIKGELWVISVRKKTSTQFQIKLLEMAKQILEKYTGNHTPTESIFKIKSYEWLNSNLKKLMLECGLSKDLTFHTARHTFATLALTNGMPIESISKVLGHTNITTTQIYAKIINKKLSNDFTQLEQNLSKILPEPYFSKNIGKLTNFDRKENGK